MRLADFHNRHAGATVIVCGCGRSLRLLQQPERFVTIGVNDVGRQFTPDYLVVVNERRQFTPERYAFVEQSRARAVFSQLDLQHPRAVRFRLGQRGGTERRDPDCLHYSNNSPYVAVDLARHMGAARIGLIGVDLDEHHFFADTGRHPLAEQLSQIDREYGALAQACRSAGIELVNLSPTSRLQSLPRRALTDLVAAAHRERRVFFVHYRFLSCGRVFDIGLREAASALGVAAEHADWDDPQLAQKIERFAPDLLFVVHGRRFVQRWGRRFASLRTAVWLLDEPYEVDDTAAWSAQFDHVFVNDAATLCRHRNAHELPVAYAPTLHATGSDARRWRVGFVGGANPSRERLLAGLARRGLLDYVVGGPWREAALGPLCRAANVPAEETAALYRDTAVVVNVFRDRHHFNRQGTTALAMNPRIVEALACGALVISEPREQLLRSVPELPVFDDEAQAAALIERFLADPAERQRVQRACAARLADATYAQRLVSVMDTVFATTAAAETPARQLAARSVDPPAAATGDPCDDADPWHDSRGVTRRAADGSIVIEPGPLHGPGTERGLCSRARMDTVEVSFEARLEPGACLVAKVHLAEPDNQSSNSYHLFAQAKQAYLARHNHVLHNVEPPQTAWVRWRLGCRGGTLSLWRDDRLVCRVVDHTLSAGHAFVGAQGGSVRIRALLLVAGTELPAAPPPEDEADTLLAVARCGTPRLSIVTTVYDRCECLRACIASVQRLGFADYEHLIVADHPPPDVLSQLQRIVSDANDPRIGLFDLKQRFNNWGIAPAGAGLRRARGEFVAFLSDDNGYTPDHFDKLLAALDREPAIGFAYSSCRYDGRLVLNHPVPRPGRIDLGQPLFRRRLFQQHLGNTLPFDMMAWDWHLVDTLMRRGVRWRHVDRLSFIFRLAKYPELAAA